MMEWMALNDGMDGSQCVEYSEFGKERTICKNKGFNNEYH